MLDVLKRSKNKIFGTLFATFFGLFMTSNAMAGKINPEYLSKLKNNKVVSKLDLSYINSNVRAQMPDEFYYIPQSGNNLNALMSEIRKGLMRPDDGMFSQIEKNSWTSNMIADNLNEGSYCIKIVKFGDVYVYADVFQKSNGNLIRVQIGGFNDDINSYTPAKKKQAFDAKLASLSDVEKKFYDDFKTYWIPEFDNQNLENKINFAKSNIKSTTDFLDSVHKDLFSAMDSFSKKELFTKDELKKFEEIRLTFRNLIYNNSIKLIQSLEYDDLKRNNADFEAFFNVFEKVFTDRKSKDLVSNLRNLYSKKLTEKLTKESFARDFETLYIPFEENSSQIRDLTVLNNFGENLKSFLEKNSNVKIEILSIVRKVEIGEDLGVKRAQVIVDYLVENFKINKGNLIIKNVSGGTPTTSSTSSFVKIYLIES